MPTIIIIKRLIMNQAAKIIIVVKQFTQLFFFTLNIFFTLRSLFSYSNLYPLFKCLLKFICLSVNSMRKEDIVD